jgi:hypothetical protein
MFSKLRKSKKGAILVTTAISMFVVFGFAAISVDVGTLLTARNQLQNAVDAAALGGASGLILSQAEAENRAVEMAAANNVINNAVNLSSTEIFFQNSKQITIQRTQAINLYFANIFGINSLNVAASASAELAHIGGTKGFRPFAIPELAWNPGQIVVIKAGSKDELFTNPSFYYPVCFPPINRGAPETGASQYENRIINGFEEIAYIGDELLIEPGMMTGPTMKGVNDLLALDSDASWNGTSIVNSDFGGLSSPRVIKIPMFDTSIEPPAGRHSITMSNMASFFLLPMQGNNVIGVFLETITSGVTGSTPTHLQMVHLVN